MAQVDFNLVQTLALGCMTLFFGTGIVHAVPSLRRANVPAAVVGGLVVAALVTLARVTGLARIGFDTSLQTPLMTAFFTSIGLGAGFSLLRAGSGQALRFLALASVLAVVQNAIGIGAALACGERPLLGVLMSSTALAGGPATALAFAQQFAAAGVPAAESLAIAAAMAGIVLGGLLGGPIATHLLERNALRGPGRARSPGAAAAHANPGRAAHEPDTGTAAADDEVEEGGVRDVLEALTVLLVAMAAGGVISDGFATAGLTLPGYVGAMLAGAVARNIDDATGWIRIRHDLASRIGSVCLTLFLTVALANLRLWELAALATPLLVNLALQAVAVALFCRWLVFPLMGRDYDAAVMTGGFTGFMLGTTANAMAVMHTLVDRFGPAPRAFVVAPIVGAFFIDFTNAIIITTFLSLLA